jgi:hypothetical protein
MLIIKNLKKEWRKRRQKMLKDKIDVTAFMPALSVVEIACPEPSRRGLVY